MTEAMKRTYFNSLLTLGRLWMLINRVISDLTSAVGQASLKTLGDVMAAGMTKDLSQ